MLSPCQHTSSTRRRRVPAVPEHEQRTNKEKTILLSMRTVGICCGGVSSATKYTRYALNTSKYSLINDVPSTFSLLLFFALAAGFRSWAHSIVDLETSSTDLPQEPRLRLNLRRRWEFVHMTPADGHESITPSERSRRTVSYTLRKAW